VGRRAEKRIAAAADVRTRNGIADLKPAAKGLRGELRHLPSRAGDQGSFRADGSQLANGPRGRHIEIVLNGKRARRWRRSQATLGYDIAAVITTSETRGATDREVIQRARSGGAK